MPARSRRTADALMGRVMGSPSFIRSRARSERICQEPGEMRALADRAEEHLRGLHRDGLTRSTDGRLDTVLGECLEIVRGCARAGDGTRGWQDSASPLVQARMRIMVAALDFFVTEDDVVPDHHRHGLLDDLLVLEWALEQAPEKGVVGRCGSAERAEAEAERAEDGGDRRQ